jgi:copper chaperone CopZ
MDYYLHHIPGRLRIKSGWLKKNQHLARQVECLLKSVEGVSSITTNLVTGSIVVHYDLRETSSENVLQALDRIGWFNRSQAVTSDELMQQAVSKVAKAARSLLFGALVKDRLEGSALSLICGLI